MEESLRITLVQSGLHWEDREKNLSMFEDLLSSVQPRGVVLLPEMFSTGFSMQPEKLAETMEGRTVDWMREVSKSRKIVLAGSVIIEEEGKYFNRMIWMLPNGNYATYDKRHLFGYAGEHEKYTPGNKRQIVSVSGWRINLTVCYDLRFPVWSRQAIKNGEAEYDVLVCVANWPEKRIIAWQTLLKARAIENQCYVAAVNRVGIDGNNIVYSGDSMIIDPLGEILQTQTGADALISFELSKKHLEEVRDRFPFLRDADEFMIKT
jgi:predicted amidohydrolase